MEIKHRAELIYAHVLITQFDGAVIGAGDLKDVRQHDFRERRRHCAGNRIAVGIGERPHGNHVVGEVGFDIDIGRLKGKYLVEAQRRLALERGAA